MTTSKLELVKKRMQAEAKKQIPNLAGYAKQEDAAAALARLLLETYIEGYLEK